MILIVEDEPVVAVDLIHAFEQGTKWTTRHVKSGADAIKFCNTYSRNLKAMVLDHRLVDGETGMSVLDHVWKMNDRVFVIVHTGFASKGLLKDRQLDGKPFAYVPKPADPRMLVDLVLKRPLWNGWQPAVSPRSVPLKQQSAWVRRSARIRLPSPTIAPVRGDAPPAGARPSFPGRPDVR
jgi:DNA-binding NtrC family response regulator